ncbi:MAG: serine/threonine protein kinase [Pseudonocardiales bacterium]|nr:serine/threonine protein kinase [Pseudonocardiales bacterium]
MTPDITADEPAPHPPGHQLAPGYVVVEHVRRGEDLDCYEAWSAQRYCRCFVKTLRPDAAADASARRHLKREARLLLSLSHPHLVRAYDYITRPDGQPPLLVLENLTGATLSYLLDRDRRRPGRGCPAKPGRGCPAKLGVADLSYLGQQLCSALRYLHSRGYLHLDVKPSNIIASQGVARLIDLSLARPPGRCPGGIGTPGYMSPEQLTGGDLGPPADVWGIGLVLYEAATATQPFDIPDVSSSTGSTLSHCHAQQSQPAPKIRTRRRLPPDVATVIDACLHRDPDQRPSLEALDAALATLTAQPPGVGPGSR